MNDPGIREFSDYIVYVDESGDHSLTSIDPQYPIFCLSFCLFRKAVYANQVSPDMRTLKYEFFGHDQVILHERDIRKKRGAFSQMGKALREEFMNRLTTIIDAVEFTLFAVVIDKRELTNRYSIPAHPYHLALEFGLERIFRFLRGKGQEGRLTHVICESRGAKEDKDLELEFRRIRDGGNYLRTWLPFEFLLVDKKTNSEGLQLADLTARPMGVSIFRPDQRNRARDVLENKLYRNSMGRTNGYGLKVFP